MTESKNEEDREFNAMVRAASKELQDIIGKYILLTNPLVPIMSVGACFLTLLLSTKTMGLPTTPFEETIAEAIQLLKKDRQEILQELPQELKDVLSAKNI